MMRAPSSDGARMSGCETNKAADKEKARMAQTMRAF
jgi:hypothetical protein